MTTVGLAPKAVILFGHARQPQEECNQFVHWQAHALNAQPARRPSSNMDQKGGWEAIRSPLHDAKPRRHAAGCRP